METDLYLLTLHAEPWGSFQLRNVYKTNVGWSSYPFLPPTAADGLLASILSGHRWMEGSFHPPRSLRTLEGHEGLVVLGGYPEGGEVTGSHFRAHVGNPLMSYEGPLWAPPVGAQSAGKKLAVVDEFLCETLRFVVIGEKGNLEGLWEKTLGRVSPFAKKGALRFRYEETPELVPLSPERASGATESLTALPMTEIGSVPKRARPYLMPVRSEAQRNRQGRYEVTWSHINCVWESGLKVREGIPVLLTDSGMGVSRSLVTQILEGR